MQISPAPALAARMHRLGTETAFEVLQKARELEARGRSIIHLEIGEPDFPTPENVREAGIRAIRDGHTHYVPSQGILPLREAIAERVSQTHGLAVHPDEVVVLPGAKALLFFAMSALLEEGDEVILPDPGFPIYESVARYLHARPVPIRLEEERGFRMDPRAVQQALSPRTRLVIINSPHNPTGGALSIDDVRSMAAVLQNHRTLVLSDEIYSRLLFDGRHFSIASIPGMKERTIILDGFSKAYAMTGWRLGYGVMPRLLARAVTQLMINCTSCTAAFTQYAGIEAIRGDQSAVQEMVREFQTRRDLIVNGLQELPGFRCARPAGAFYAFPNITATGFSSRELQNRLMEEAGVAVLAGTAFGAAGEGYLRFSYANSRENIRRALQLMTGWLEQHRAA